MCLSGKSLKPLPLDGGGVFPDSSGTTEGTIACIN
jgi:hypothetical protein